MNSISAFTKISPFDRSLLDNPPSSAKRKREELSDSSSSSSDYEADGYSSGGDTVSLSQEDAPEKRQKTSNDLCTACENIKKAEQPDENSADRLKSKVHRNLAKLYSERAKYHPADCPFQPRQTAEEEEQEVVPETGAIPDLIEKIFHKTNGRKWDNIIKHAEKALTIIAAQPEPLSRSEYFRRRQFYFHSTAAIAAYEAGTPNLINGALNHLQKARTLTKNPQKLSIIHVYTAKLLARRGQPKGAAKTCDLCRSIEVLKLAPPCSRDKSESELHEAFAKLYKQRSVQGHPSCVPKRLTRSLSSWLKSSSYSESQE